MSYDHNHAGPRCPKCLSGYRSGVVETRSHDGRTFRRRRCECGTTFYTAEQVMKTTIWRATKGAKIEIAE